MRKVQNLETDMLIIISSPRSPPHISTVTATAPKQTHQSSEGTLWLASDSPQFHESALNSPNFQIFHASVAVAPKCCRQTYGTLGYNIKRTPQEKCVRSDQSPESWRLLSQSGKLLLTGEVHTRWRLRKRGVARQRGRNIEMNRRENTSPFNVAVKKYVDQWFLFCFFCCSPNILNHK